MNLSFILSRTLLVHNLILHNILSLSYHKCKGTCRKRTSDNKCYDLRNFERVVKLKVIHPRIP